MPPRTRTRTGRTRTGLLRLLTTVIVALVMGAAATTTTTVTRVEAPPPTRPATRRPTPPTQPSPTKPPLASYVAEAAQRRPQQPNVLFIYVDDLRIDVSPYNTTAPIATPALARLAQSSLLFKRAYCAQTVCAPSRFSLLSGRRPDVLQAWNFLSPMRGRTNGVQSLPQIFRDAGYYTKTIGKVFHWINLPNALDDRKWSWDAWDVVPAGTETDTQCPGDSLYCTCGSANTQACVDQQISAAAASTLAEMARKNKPFFLAVGFRRPHPSFIVPTWFRNQIAGSSYGNLPLTRVPPNFNLTYGMPSLAFYSCRGIQGTPQFPAGSNPLLPWTPADADAVMELRRQYWLSAAFMDSQLAVVLNALDNEPRLAGNTIVVFTSDHGWNLAERNMFCKQSLFETTARVPLLVRVPWLSGSSGGRVVETVVEQLDVMPTVVSLAGRGAQMNNCPQGRDLTPFFLDQDYAAQADADELTGGLDLTGDVKTPWDAKPADWGPLSFALTQYPRCGVIGVPPSRNPWNDPCTGTTPNLFQYMGYSLRTPRWRYTEWRVWNGLVADWSASGLNATELYDHAGDDTAAPNQGTGFDLFENRNVAADFPDVVQVLSRALRHVALIPDPYPNGCMPLTPGTVSPTAFPTAAPTDPTASPTTRRPTTKRPTSLSPTTRNPTVAITSTPSAKPTTGAPTQPRKTKSPSSSPTDAPTPEPTPKPTSGAPSRAPTRQPTRIPTDTCSVQATCATADWTCGVPVSAPTACGGGSVACPCWSWGVSATS